MYCKFKDLADLKNVSAYKVAKDLGFSQSLFSDWKSGRSVPKHDKLQRLAEYFDVPVSYFYETDDEATKQYHANLATNYLAQKLRDDQKALMRSAVDLSPEEVVAVDMFIKALKGEK